MMIYLLFMSEMQISLFTSSLFRMVITKINKQKEGEEAGS